MKYTIKLEPYNGIRTRFKCPNCKHENSFVRYINIETGEYIDENVGRCNREEKCRYHYTPKQYYAQKQIPQNNLYKKPQSNLDITQNQEKTKSFVPVSIFIQSLNIEESTTTIASRNNFVAFLTNRFGIEVATELIERYYLGTSEHWPKSTVFWQIDNSGKIRTGKIMLYNSDSGKRIKKPYNHITWVHKTSKLKDFNLSQCLFGEHLLKDKSKTIALVESEKTAIIASAYLPHFLWLAVGSLSNLNPSICSALKGRKVVLFPDLKCYQKWSEKANNLSSIGSFIVSDLLERTATEEEKDQGYDIADYLLKFDINEFRNLFEK